MPVSSFGGGLFRGQYTDPDKAYREEKSMKLAGYETRLTKSKEVYTLRYRLPKMKLPHRIPKPRQEPRDEELKVLDEGWV